MEWLGLSGEIYPDRKKGGVFGWHREELPVPVRTVVTVCGAMRGVGGIDSWGTDVERPYHVSGEDDHSVSFTIRLTNAGR